MKLAVYRSCKREGLYLYAREEFDLDTLPAPLRQSFGRAEKAMELELTPERKLARVNAVDLIAAIEKQGFYIQLPPTQIAETDSA